MIAQRDVITAHRGIVTAHRDVLTAHMGIVTAHRDIVTVHSGVVTAHRDEVTAHRGVAPLSLVLELNCLSKYPANIEIKSSDLYKVLQGIC